MNNFGEGNHAIGAGKEAILEKGVSAVPQQRRAAQRIDLLYGPW